MNPPKPDLAPRHPDGGSPAAGRILYCHCAYANVVPEDVKHEVLRQLSDSGVAFDAVADLCEMSAQKDPALQGLVQDGNVKIAACFPRAVRWLFHAAKVPLPEKGVDVINMRVESADTVVSKLLPETARAHGNPA